MERSACAGGQGGALKRLSSLLGSSVQVNTKISFDVCLDERSTVGSSYNVVATLIRLGTEVDRALKQVFPLFSEADPETFEVHHHSPSE
ncbi:MAG: hypothetical protein ACI9EF_002064 [Pseudohongiellaceae bacterium]